MTWLVVGFEPRTRQCSGGCSKTVVTSVSASSMASGVSAFFGAEFETTELPEWLEWPEWPTRPLAFWAVEAELALFAAANCAAALLEPLEFFRCVKELMMEVERMGLRKGCKLTLEAAMIRMEAANIWEVVPTVSYFFSFTCKIQMNRILNKLLSQHDKWH